MSNQTRKIKVEGKEITLFVENDNDFNYGEFAIIKNQSGLNRYKISIKEHIIPKLTKKDIKFVYPSEADILNKALFGMTASEWKEKNPDKKGNMRDLADVYQLVCLANLETHNAEFIKQSLSQSQRVQKLNSIAISQIKSLTENLKVKKLLRKNDTTF